MGIMESMESIVMRNPKVAHAIVNAIVNLTVLAICVFGCWGVYARSITDLEISFLIFGLLSCTIIALQNRFIARLQADERKRELIREELLKHLQA